LWFYKYAAPTALETGALRTPNSALERLFSGIHFKMDELNDSAEA
jgi:hypothetical protein